MPRKITCWRCWCHTLLVLLSVQQFASKVLAHPTVESSILLPLLHALTGSQFEPTGTVSGTLDGKGASTVTLQRVEWTAAQAAAFADLARADGFYRVRLQPQGAAAPVLASVRARCMLAAGFKERLVLHIGSDISIMGLEYGPMPPRGCPPGMPLDERKLEGIAPAAAAVPVFVSVPEAAPQIVLGPGMGSWEGSLVGRAQAAAASGGEQQRSGGGAAAAGKDGGGKAAAPEEKSWIQRNWLFVLPVAMLALNVLTATMGSSENTGGASGGGSAAAAGRR